MSYAGHYLSENSKQLCHLLCQDCWEAHAFGKPWPWEKTENKGGPGFCCRCGTFSKKLCAINPKFLHEDEKPNKSPLGRDWEQCVGRDDEISRVSRKEVLLPNPEEERKS